MSCDLKGLFHNVLKPLLLDKPVLTSLLRREPLLSGPFLAFEWTRQCGASPSSQNRTAQILSSSRLSVQAERFASIPSFKSEPESQSPMQKVSKPSLADRFIHGAMNLFWDFGQTLVKKIDEGPVRRSFRTAGR